MLRTQQENPIELRQKLAAAFQRSDLSVSSELVGQGVRLPAFSRGSNTVPADIRHAAMLAVQRADLWSVFMAAVRYSYCEERRESVLRCALGVALARLDPDAVERVLQSGDSRPSSAYVASSITGAIKSPTCPDERVAAVVSRSHACGVGFDRPFLTEDAVLAGKWLTATTLIECGAGITEFGRRAAERKGDQGAALIETIEHLASRRMPRPS